jgi:hypothetical protein
MSWCGRRFHFRQLRVVRGDRVLASYGVDVDHTPFAATLRLGC